MKQVQLTQGKVALVDDEDFERLSKFKWHALYTKGHWYAVRTMDKRLIFMHREIMAAPSRAQVDHKDGNGLNNQQYNLRLATNAQNGRNRGKQHNNTSGYKGVYWNKQDRKWRANIRCDGRIIHLGYFVNSEDAARAYNDAAIKYFGEFAKLNEIPKGDKR